MFWSRFFEADGSPSIGTKVSTCDQFNNWLVAAVVVWLVSLAPR